MTNANNGGADMETTDIIGQGSQLVRIAANHYAGRCTYIAVATVNRGETPVTSRTFKSMKGAEKWARKWLGIDAPEATTAVLPAYEPMAVVVEGGLR